MLVTKPTGEYYKIENLQEMQPFFFNIVSSSNVWMFLSSNGAPAAGRGNAGASIFPYETDDRLHLATSTGPKTLIRFPDGRVWEPFNTGYENPYKISRSLYKRVTGDAVIFEEINHDYNLLFSYRWETSTISGIVRTSDVINLGEAEIEFEILDGVENIIPHGIHPSMAANSSCLTDAYKAVERPDGGALSVYSITAAIGDTVEPVEVLRANIVWYIGDKPKFLLSSRQLKDFALGKQIEDEERTAGRKGAFFVWHHMKLAPKAEKDWIMLMDANKTQKDIVAAILYVKNTDEEILRFRLAHDIKMGTEKLLRVVGATDGIQLTGDKMSVARHFMYSLYNNMRGGVFYDFYSIERHLFIENAAIRNKGIIEKHKTFFEDTLYSVWRVQELHEQALLTGDPDIIRLAFEFLPITFSRRHGDPSRPWNYFNIRVADDEGNDIYHYEGNWRDIFQNWEAMCLSFPHFIVSIIAKFLNASTVDGFNPYRINSEGIDWETPMPHDPWAGTGYWGDHQIVYLNKLLEWLLAYTPEALNKLTKYDTFTYANVPYEIVPYESILKDAKHTVAFNYDKHNSIMEKEHEYGTDIKLLMSGKEIYHASFVEKLLVPILAKLSNLVVGGGIWMNTQRPEWNDANNAIVGNGLSMVTVYQLYRHIGFCLKLCSSLETDSLISTEVKTWFDEINDVIKGRVSLSPRAFLDKAGESFGKYRKYVYENSFSGKVIISTKELDDFFNVTLTALGETIDANKREDGMYHSYNILTLTKDSLKVSHLFLMLEGQTAVLGSGRLSPKEALALVQTMENSDLMNKKLGQFFLYPMKNLHTFVERNIIPKDIALKSSFIKNLIRNEHEGFVLLDKVGNVRFHETIRQSSDIENALNTLSQDEKYKENVENEADLIREIYEVVFEHKQFTGRSGIMYKYEGIGCIFWHQNSKFMLSLQEAFIEAAKKDREDAKALKEAYYRLQQGLGFRHNPTTWGAFPMDPYSHTPYDMPAQQPGLTGQVKEEVLNRMAELGVSVENGIVTFDPKLLRKEEFLRESMIYKFIDFEGHNRTLEVPAGSLAFTICQVPIVYTLSDTKSIKVIERKSETTLRDTLVLGEKYSKHLFRRGANILRIDVEFGPDCMV